GERAGDMRRPASEREVALTDLCGGRGRKHRDTGDASEDARHGSDWWLVAGCWLLEANNQIYQLDEDTSSGVTAQRGWYFPQTVASAPAISPTVARRRTASMISGINGVRSAAWPRLA